MALPHPQLRNKRIDEVELRNLVVIEGELCSPLEYDEFAERFTIADVGEMLDASTKRKQEHYEMIAVAVKVGYINAKNKGKDHTIFKKQQDHAKAPKASPERYQSAEEKKKAMDDLFKSMRMPL